MTKNRFLNKKRFSSLMLTAAFLLQGTSLLAWTEYQEKQLKENFRISDISELPEPEFCKNLGQSAFKDFTERCKKVMPSDIEKPEERLSFLKILFSIAGPKSMPFDYVERIPPEMRTKCLMTAKDLIKKEMVQFDVEVILAFVNLLPNDERFDQRVTLAKTLVKEGMDAFEIGMVFKSVSLLPNDERIDQRVILAKDLIKEGMNSFEIGAIFRGVNTLPNDERFDKRADVAKELNLEKAGSAAFKSEVQLALNYF